MVYELLIAVARLSAALGGLSLLWLAAFLYEDEERKVQNRLAEWWLKIHSWNSERNNRLAGFVRAVTLWTGDIIDRFMGKKLFSLQAIGVSGCLSLASFALALSLDSTLIYVYSLTPMPEVLTAIAFLVLVAAAVSGALPKVPGWVPAATAAIVLMARIALELSDPWMSQVGFSRIAYINSSVLVLAVLSDVIVLAFARMLLRDMGLLPRAFGCSALVLFAGSLVVIPPMLLASGDWPYAGLSVVLAIMNAPVFLIGGIAALVALCLIVYALSESLLSGVSERVIYQLEKLRIVEKKKILCSVAGPVLVAAFFPEKTNDLLLTIGRLVGLSGS